MRTGYGQTQPHPSEPTLTENRVPVQVCWFAHVPLFFTIFALCIAKISSQYLRGAVFLLCMFRFSHPARLALHGQISLLRLRSIDSSHEALDHRACMSLGCRISTGIGRTGCRWVGLIVCCSPLRDCAHVYAYKFLEIAWYSPEKEG